MVTQRTFGFTLIEAVITLVIISIIGGILGPFFMQGVDVWSLGTIQSRRLDQHRNALTTLVSDIESVQMIGDLGFNNTTLMLPTGGVISYALVADGNGTFNLRRTEGTMVSPIATSLAPNGLKLRYYDMGHNETANPLQVRMVTITITSQLDSQTYTSGTSVVVNARGPHVITRL